MASTIEEMICEIPEELESIRELENIIDQCSVKISNIRNEKFWHCFCGGVNSLERTICPDCGGSRPDFL
jgi:hypothetical protein